VVLVFAPLTIVDVTSRVVHLTFASEVFLVPVAEVCVTLSLEDYSITFSFRLTLIAYINIVVFFYLDDTTFPLLTFLITLLIDVVVFHPTPELLIVWLVIYGW